MLWELFSLQGLSYLMSRVHCFLLLHQRHLVFPILLIPILLQFIPWAVEGDTMAEDSLC